MSVSQNQHVSDTHTRKCYLQTGTHLYVSDYLKKTKKINFRIQTFLR